MATDALLLQKKQEWEQWLRDHGDLAPGQTARVTVQIIGRPRRRVGPLLDDPVSESEWQEVLALTYPGDCRTILIKLHEGGNEPLPTASAPNWTEIGSSQLEQINKVLRDNCLLFRLNVLPKKSRREDWSQKQLKLYKTSPPSE